MLSQRQPSEVFYKIDALKSFARAFENTYFIEYLRTTASVVLKLILLVSRSFTSLIRPYSLRCIYMVVKNKKLRNVSADI